MPLMKRSVRYFVTSTAVAAAGSVLALGALPTAVKIPLSFPDVVGFPVLIGLAAVMEAFSITLVTPTGGRTASSVASVPQLAMIPLFGPFAAVVGTAVAETLARSSVRRPQTVKIVFNVAQITLATAGAASTYVLIGGQSAATLELNPRTVLALGTSAGVYFGLNSVLVAAVTALDSGAPFAATWRSIYAGKIPGDAAAAAVALLLVVLYSRAQLLGVLLVLLPLLFLHHTNRVNVALHQINWDLLRLIVRTIEAKDPYTSGHSMRVADISRRVAEEMRLPRKAIHTVETAALLHDFGKVDIAYGDIISHPGPLTEKQRKIISSHPIRGAELLASISTLDRAIIKAVRHHHEHFDGSGYPDGLAGESIPLSARIIMVADTVDAMLSARPYRPALSPASVESELRRLSGRQFDPVVVEALLRCGVLASSTSTAEETELSAPEAVEPLAPERATPGLAPSTRAKAI